MSNLLDKIREGFSSVFEKTEEFSRMGRIKMEIASLHRQIEGLFIELGAEIYNVFKTEGEVKKNEKIDSIISSIKKLEEELDKKEKELEEV